MELHHNFSNWATGELFSLEENWILSFWHVISVEIVISHLDIFVGSVVLFLLEKLIPLLVGLALLSALTGLFHVFNPAAILISQVQVSWVHAFWHVFCVKIVILSLDEGSIGDNIISIVIMVKSLQELFVMHSFGLSSEESGKYKQ
jgi:hypothetical protein